MGVGGYDLFFGWVWLSLTFFGYEWVDEGEYDFFLVGCG